MSEINEERIERRDFQEQLLSTNSDIAELFDGDDIDVIVYWFNDASTPLLRKALKSFEASERYRVCSELLIILNKTLLSSSEENGNN